MSDKSCSYIGAYVPFRRFLKRGSEEGGHVKKKICMIDAKGLGCTLGVDKLKALKCQSCPKIRRVPFPEGKFQPHLGSTVKVRMRDRISQEGNKTALCGDKPVVA